MHAGTDYPRGFTGFKRLVPAQHRLAAALTVSAAVHFWLATGVGVEAPPRSAPRGPAQLDVRLEPFASPPAEIPGLPESETTDATRHADAAPVADKVGTRQAARTPAVRSSAPAGDALDRTTTDAPASALPQISDPHYYPARQLDVYPALLQPLKLVYPSHAAQAGVQGRITVMLLIDEHGAVDEVSVVQAQPAGYFEEGVRAAMLEARFTPARKDGRAVKSRVLINVSYEPAESGGAAP